MAFALLWVGGSVSGPGATAAFLFAALAIQLRLLCNLLDGLVAVEGGRAEADGAFWNEVPDRMADLAILVGAGLACGSLAFGFAAASAALATAYMRAISVGFGQGDDFCGPFAKKTRMDPITLAALVAAVEGPLFGSGLAMAVALWVVALSAAVTALRRAARLLGKMRNPLKSGDP